MALNRKIVVANVPENVPALLEYGNLLIRKFTGNTLLPSASPTIAVFTTDLADLETTELDLKASGGSIAARNAAAELVKLNIRRWVNYVQSVADANPANAGEIIDNSGFFIKGRSAHTPRGFEVTSIGTGKVELRAPANAEGYPYGWEASTDNENWTFLRMSRLATCTVDNLTSGTVYYIRYFSLDKDNNYTPVSQALNVRVD